MFFFSRATIENSVRPNENHPQPTVRTWADQRPAWDTIWYRDRPHWDTLWYRQPSPVLSHALASLQTLDSPVHEERTPPALRGSHRSWQQNLDEEYVQERNDHQEDNSDYVFRADAPQEDTYLADSAAADQSQNYPTYELPLSDG